MNKNKNTKIILFSKAPIVNQVKTRLAGFTGSLEAAKLYEAFLKDTIVLVDNVIDSCGDDNKIEKYIYYFPKKAFTYFKALAKGSWKLSLQKGNDLGQKMMNAFYEQKENINAAYLSRQDCQNEDLNAGLLSTCHNSIIIIGSDSPTLPSAYVKDAIHALKKYDIVLGPAYDGGFYLIGINKINGNIFNNVRWSSHYTLKDVLKNIKKEKLNLKLLPKWYDVDDYSGYMRLKKTLKFIEKQKYPNTLSLMKLIDGKNRKIF